MASSMSPLVLGTFTAYIIAIFLVSRFAPRAFGGRGDFFLAGRNTPWWIVSIGMLGDSISGVSFVSVPGMVGAQDMTYLQLCFGFFLGYIVVAYVLLPLYYRLQLISIYEYIGARLGRMSYRTAALFFLIAKMFGASAKLYLVSLVLHQLLFAALGFPYPLTVVLLVSLIWLYTRRGGMGTIVWTDTLQTVCLLLALILMVVSVAKALGLDFLGLIELVETSKHHRILELGDWKQPAHLMKQLLSGTFIVIVMTGLDQNMMQKNLTCRTLREAQKNMLTYGIGFIPLNYIFLVLGILLLVYAERYGIALPQAGDQVLPFLAANYLGPMTLVCFTLGMTASSCSNADSALTSLTTSFAVDILGMREANATATRQLQWVHCGMCASFALIIIGLSLVPQRSVLDTIYVAVSYTYGPLLGLYAFGLATKLQVRDRWVPLVCLLSPFISHLVKLLLERLGYQTGYELLLLNGALTMLGLWLLRLRHDQPNVSLK